MSWRTRRSSVREPLERLAAQPWVLGALGLGEQVVRQPRDPAGPQLGAFASDPAERRAPGGRGLGAPERPFLVAGSLVVARRFEQEQDARVAARLRGPRLAPGRTVARGLGGHALEELAQRDVAPSPLMGFAQALGGERWHRARRRGAPRARRRAPSRSGRSPGIVDRGSIAGSRRRRLTGARGVRPGTRRSGSSGAALCALSRR